MDIGGPRNVLPARGVNRQRRFRDRWEAGALLGLELTKSITTPTLVLGLPRGGVVVAGEVARALNAPLDVILVRKLGVPYQPELAMGAVGEEGIRILDQALIKTAMLTEAEVRRVEEQERANIVRAARLFRGDGPPPDLTDRAVVIVDDGIATGATVFAACQVARMRKVRALTVAVPVAAAEAVERLRALADRVVSLVTSKSFGGISQFYEHFPSIDNDVVLSILKEAAARHANSPPDEEIGGR